jgi:soluble lytic murein transglycosylase
MRKRFLLFLAIMILSASCNLPVNVSVFDTPTPENSPTPTLTPTLPPTPTTTPTPTPQPAARVEIAEQAIFLGSYDQARQQFLDAQNTSDDPEIQAAAAVGIGRSLYLARNYPNAIRNLENAVAEFPQSGQITAAGYYFLARSYEAQQLYAKAAEAYGMYVELNPGVLDAYIQGLRGDALNAAGDYSGAVLAFEASVNAPQEGTTVWTELKLGRAYAALGDYSNAIRTYLEVYDKTDNEYAKSQANLLMGQAYLNLGMTEQANARFQDSVYNFPRAYDSHTALVHLVNAGAPVSELNRGIVNYHAGQHGLAVEALTRYIGLAAELNATAYHYRALSRRAMNEPGRALVDWDYIIENYQGDPLWAEAWSEKAYTQWAFLGENEAAARTLQQFVELSPNSARAGDFLFQAGRILERKNKLVEAAVVWEKIIDTYPTAERSQRALFLAGVTYYRLRNYPQALVVFQRALVFASEPADQAAAYLWIGKTKQILGEADAARQAWQQGAQVDPTGYYSERSIELLHNRKPFDSTRPVDLGYDLDFERTRAENWLRVTFGISEDTDLNGLGSLANDPRMQRGAAFWELGLYHNARTEFEGVRRELASQPELTYRLMNYLLDLGVYRSAILASRSILDAAGMDDVSTLSAPAYFNHVRFGVYFRDLVLQASQTEGLHPLLLLSVMRQESMFEGFAISSAGARGLMQIMPATGQEISNGLNWPPEYTNDDLYRAEVSIRFGARYLKRQRDYFEGNMFAMLAAYNGGPGNTIIWKELAGDDPDLLLEVIRVEETRLYINNIYEFFNIYRIIYEPGGL